MKVLTYTSYKEQNDLFTKIQSSVAVNGCQFGLAQKDIILLSKASLIFYKAGKLTGATNTDHISFTLSGITYAIDDFDAKTKIAILQQIQDWKPLQIKDLKPFIPKEYLFMADNTISYALGIQDNYLEMTTFIRSTLVPGSYKTSLDTSFPQKLCH